MRALVPQVRLLPGTDPADYRHNELRVAAIRVRRDNQQSKAPKKSALAAAEARERGDRDYGGSPIFYTHVS